MVVMASAGQGFTRGQVSFLNIDIYVNQSLLVFSTNKEKLLSLYLYYNLKMRYEELRQLSNSSSIRGSLNKANISKFNINLPSIDNQEKIVKLLHNIDQKIIINQKINNNISLFFLFYLFVFVQLVNFFFE